MDFSKHLAKAEEALRRKNFDFAIDLYRQLLDLDPDQEEARSGLRVAARRRFEAKQGSKLLRSLSGAVPLGKARSLIKLNKHAAAAKALEDYLAKSPLDEEANLLLGQSLEAAGHKRSAKAVYEFLAEIAPKNPEGLKRAGAMFAAAGDVPGALGYYERALEADPRDQESLKARKDLAAEAALQSSRLDEVGHSREALADQAQAQQLERQRKLVLSPEELEAELERLEARYADEPGNPDLLLELADIHEKRKDFEAALDMARRASDYRKDDEELAARCGKLEVKALKRRLAQADKAGDRELADRLEGQLNALELRDVLARAERRPGDLGLQVELAKLQMRAGEYDAALSALQRAQDDPARARDVAFLKARCFQEKGFADLATSEFERALQGLPSSDDRAKEILYNLGLLAEAAGDSERARGLYARVFEVDIGYRDVSAKMEALR